MMRFQKLSVRQKVFRMEIIPQTLCSHWHTFTFLGHNYISVVDTFILDKFCQFLYHRRSTRLSAQKNLEQKEKHHVKMKAKRCATPLIINEIPPSKKMKV